MGKRSGERRTASAVNLAVRGQHAVLKRIKQRTFPDSTDFRKCCSAGPASRIPAQPFDISKPEDDIAANLMSDQGM
jgi:hypothetical protein